MAIDMTRMQSGTEFDQIGYTIARFVKQIAQQGMEEEARQSIAGDKVLSVESMNRRMTDLLREMEEAVVQLEAHKNR